MFENNIKNFVEKSDKTKFDIILVGYSMHHIHYEEKQQFLDNCFKCLKDNGYLIHYDIIRFEDQTRDEYLKRYYKILDDWDKMETHEIQSIKEHITECDFPSSYKELNSMVEKSGINSEFIELFTDKFGVHSLCHFIKKN